MIKVLRQKYGVREGRLSHGNYFFDLWYEKKSDIMMWHECMTQFNMAWNDTTWHDMTRQDIMQHHTMWYGTWHGMKDTIWCNMTWHNASQHEMTWHNMMQNHYITCHDMNWHHKKTIQQEVKWTIFVKEAITWINLTEIIQKI